MSNRAGLNAGTFHEFSCGRFDERGQLADLRDEQLLRHRRRRGPVSRLPQREGGEPQQVQQSVPQQGRLREDRAQEDLQHEAARVAGSAQRSAAGGRREARRAAPGRGHHHSQHSQVFTLIVLERSFF